MTVHALLRPELLHPQDLPEHELVDFFRTSYGDDYRGDAKMIKKIDEAEHLVVLRHPMTNQLGAAALAAGGRITTPATSPNREQFGSRSVLMTHLLRACHEKDVAQWITIGTRYDRMQQTARAAGMYLLNNLGTAEKFLEDIGEADKYSLKLERNTVVTTSEQAGGELYEQNIWMWPQSEALDLVG